MNTLLWLPAKLPRFTDEPGEEHVNPGTELCATYAVLPFFLVCPCFREEGS